MVNHKINIQDFETGNFCGYIACLYEQQNYRQIHMILATFNEPIIKRWYNITSKIASEIIGNMLNFGVLSEQEVLDALVDKINENEK